MSTPHPWSVLAQCVICGWQGHVEQRALDHRVVPRYDPKYLANSCHQCGAMKLIDRSTQAPRHA